MEIYCVGCKKLLRTKTQILEKLNTIDQCFCCFWLEKINLY